MIRVAAKMFLALSVLALFPLWGRGAAGAGRDERCPRLSVSCPDTADTAGPIVFAVNVAGGAAAGKMTFNWVVSAGAISGGQGEPFITVDVAGLDGTAVEATVEVGGLRASCPKTATCATSITPRCRLSKMDEYGNVNFEDEQARLNNFAIELQNNPQAQGYIIAYGGRRGRAGEAQRRADRAKDYLVNTRGLDASLLVTLDGGFREDLTVELYVIPVGAHPPAASPTVDPAEVQILPDEPETDRPPGGRGD